MHGVIYFQRVGTAQATYQQADLSYIHRAKEVTEPLTPSLQTVFRSDTKQSNKMTRRVQAAPWKTMSTPALYKKGSTISRRQSACKQHDHEQASGVLHVHLSLIRLC